MSFEKLEKDHNRGVICGVIAGFAKYGDDDPVVLRIGYCLLGLILGIIPAIVIYIILSICMPSEEEIE